MKLDIEALAREAGYKYADEGDATMKNHAEFQKNFHKAFARLIVERCAVECKLKAGPFPGEPDGYDAREAADFAAWESLTKASEAILGLLEDK